MLDHRAPGDDRVVQSHEAVGGSELEGHLAVQNDLVAHEVPRGF